MVPRTGCSDIRILLVDDEASFRTSLAEMLRDDGHGVLDYGAPGEIADLQDLGGVAVLVTDYEMPGRTGIGLADDFHGHHPETPVILVTAYRTPWIDAQSLDRPYLRVIQKPVDYDVIHRAIHDAVRGG